MVEVKKTIRTTAVILLALFAFGAAVQAKPEILLADYPLTGVGYEIDLLNNSTSAVFVSIPNNGTNNGALFWLNIDGMGDTNDRYIPLNGGNSHPWGLAVYNSATTPKVFVTGQEDMQIYVYNINADNVSTISLGGNPYAVAVNSTTGKVFVTNTSNNTISVFDANTHAALGIMMKTGADGINFPAGVVVNEVTNKVYVTSRNNGKILVFNGSTYAWIKTINTYMNPEQMSVDTANNRIFVQHSGGAVGIIDGATDILLSSYISISTNITDVAYHPDINNVYISSAVDSKFHAYETYEYTKVADSPVTMTHSPRSIAALYPHIGPAGYSVLISVNDDATLSILGDSDTYPPRFSGLAYATDSQKVANPTVTLSWPEATDISTPITYKVYASDKSGDYNWASPVYTTGSFATMEVALPTLEYGKKYYFVVRASDGAATPNEDSNLKEFSATLTDGAAPVGGLISSVVDTHNGGEVTVSWSLATDDHAPIYYDIYIATASGAFNWSAPFKTVTGALSTNLTGLQNNLKYYFVVRARDSGGLRNSNWGQLDATPTDTVAPTFAGMKTAGDDTTGGTVQLAWDAATDPSTPIKYRVFYNQGATIASWTQYQKTVSSLSTEITGLTNNVQYAFAVRAEDNFGNRDTNVVTKNVTPTDLIYPTFNGLTSCMDVGAGNALKLRWSEASDKSHPITYKIYMSTSTSTFNFAAPNYTVQDTYYATATGLTMGTAYFFVAKAADAVDNTTGSESAYIPNPDLPGYLPCVPTDGVNPVFSGLTSATATGATGTVLLTWNEAVDSSGPIKYNIFYSTSPISNYTTPNTSIFSATSVTIIGLNDGTTYYFAVRAEDAGHRKDSNTVQKTAKPNDGNPPVFPNGIKTLTDKATFGTLTATWDAAVDPSSPITYYIYVSDSPSSQKFSSPPYMTTQSTTADITGLTNNKRYYVAVRAVDSGGVSTSNTQELFATATDQTPPTFAGVSSVTDQKTGGALKVDWAVGSDPSTPVTYLIYRADGATGSYNFATANYSTIYHPYIVNGLNNGTLYRFIVRARDNASPPNSESNSVELSGTPTDQVPPTFAGITGLTNGGSRSLIPSWNQASDTSTPISYNIYYGTSADPAAILAGGVRATTTETFKLISGLTNGTTYYFIVRAVDRYGNEDTNTTKKGTTPYDQDPPAFAGLKTVTDTKKGGEATVTWDPATDESPPIVYIVTWTTGATESLYLESNPNKTTTQSTSVTVSSLTNNVQYKFAVRAKDSSSPTQNQEANTVVGYVTPTDQTPPTWSGLQSVTDSKKGGEITLSWSAATDRSEPVYYNVFLSTTSNGQNFATTPYRVSGTTTYHITSLTNGQRLYAIVTAEDSSTYANHTSTNSTELFATPTDQTPPTFAGASAVSIYSEDGKLKLDWGAAYDRSTPISFNIYKAATSGGYNYSAPAYTVSGTSTYIVPGFLDGQYAFFVVRAKDAYNNEDTNTNEKNIRYRDIVGPNEPTGVSAIAGDASSTPGDEYVTLSWSTPTTNWDDSPLIDLTGFRIYRGEEIGQYDLLPVTIPATATSYKDTSVVADHTYYYGLIAYDDANPANMSALSEVVSASPVNADDAIPLPPDRVTATATDSQVALSWRRPEFNTDGSRCTDLQGYYIYRSETKGSNYGLITPSVIAANVSQYTDTNVLNDHTYYYVIKSLDSADPPNESAFSSEVYATPGKAPDLPPKAPANLAVTVGVSSNFLQWDATTKNSDNTPITDLDGYFVYRSENCGATGVQKLTPLPITTSPVFTDSSVTTEKQYSYYVTAVDLAGHESEPSNTVVAVRGGTKGVTGTLLYRNIYATDTAGYKVSGLACRVVRLVDSAGAVLATGYSSSNGSFKIVYDAASPDVEYKVRIDTQKGEGFPYSEMNSGTGAGNLIVVKKVKIGTGFKSVDPVPVIGIGPAAGDANCDGKINITDLTVIKPSYNKTSSSPDYRKYADTNGDGKVNINDLQAIKGYYNYKLDLITPSLCTN